MSEKASPEYVCIECLEPFTGHSAKYSLTRHRKQHAQRQVIQCRRCHTTFLTRRNFKTHVKKCGTNKDDYTEIELERSLLSSPCTAECLTVKQIDDHFVILGRDPGVASVHVEPSWRMQALLNQFVYRPSIEEASYTQLRDTQAWTSLAWNRIATEATCRRLEHAYSILENIQEHLEARAVVSSFLTDWLSRGIRFLPELFQSIDGTAATASNSMQVYSPAYTQWILRSQDANTSDVEPQGRVQWQDDDLGRLRWIFDPMNHIFLEIVMLEHAELVKNVKTSQKSTGSAPTPLTAVGDDNNLRSSQARGEMMTPDYLNGGIPLHRSVSAHPDYSSTGAFHDPNTCQPTGYNLPQSHSQPNLYGFFNGTNQSWSSQGPPT